ncbi:MAG: 50S ribosome-binding GTPase [Defluviitaleaceae bacterium]|nr:50S ribosome-binding GTPase [Defluviitaleaceae bacterium]
MIPAIVAGVVAVTAVAAAVAASNSSNSNSSSGSSSSGGGGGGGYYYDDDDDDYYYDTNDGTSNVIITGVTGAGKSSTINALLKREDAKVGVGVNPETKGAHSYLMDEHSITLWDTPGLGDGVEQDKENIRQILDSLTRDCLVVVVIDGYNKDMGMTYVLLDEIKHTVKPHQISIVINQADVAMKGENWDMENKRPNKELLKFLEEQALSIQRRIFETSKLEVALPIFYSAMYGYNVDKLLDNIITNTSQK